MNFDLKNTIIIVLFLYLISGNIFKVFMGTTKALVYLVLFFMVISKISPDLYSKIGEIFNLKKIEYHNVIDMISYIITKILSCVPIIKNLVLKNDKQNKPNDN
jgi:hypothetical protein